MSENNNINEFDLMMKSVLDEAQEAVPESVWEGVSAGLDMAAHKKAVVLWWRRAAVGIAAAAAVILVVFFAYNIDNQIVPAGGNNEIAVVEVVADTTETEGISLLADMGDAPAVTVMQESSHADDVAAVIPESASEFMEVTAEVRETSEDEASVPEETPASEPSETEVAAEPVKVEPAEYFPEDWGEEQAREKRKVSLVLSGVTGTNNTLSQNRLSPMMRPSISPAPKKTGIEETSVKSSYGIPLSFGAGVKVGLGKKWSIGTGLNYTYLSRQFYGKYTKVDAEGGIESITSSDIRNQQHYIGIPVNVYYDIVSTDRISFYAYGGGMVEKCISDSYSLLNTDITHRESAPGVQLSADAGIGVEFMLGRHLGLYIDPSVRYYFKNENQPKSIRTVQPLMLGFEIGFRAML